eukprot:12209823-Ditylum_brightwellii.AAC.1
MKLPSCIITSKRDDEEDSFNKLLSKDEVEETKASINHDTNVGDVQPTLNNNVEEPPVPLDNE